MKAEKYIANVKSKAQKMIENLRTEADEAYRDWADTGYQRYMTKNEQLLAEADKLEAFINPQKAVEQAWAAVRAEKERKEALKMLLNSVCNIVECDMEYDFPDCAATRALEAVMSEYKSIKGK